MSTQEKEIADIAAAILSGKIHPIEGCRVLCRLRHNVGSQYSELFDSIRGIESETDDLPLGEARSTCAKEYLARIDAEVDEFLKQVQPELIGSCKKLIETFEQ